MEKPNGGARSPTQSEARPIVVVSQCLGFAAVRYNGQVLQDAFVKALGQHVEFVQVCPEVAIGLGVPRDPIRIVSDESGQRLVQPATGRDLTVPMRRYAGEFLATVRHADGFILKSRSPSCGIKDVKTYRAVNGQAAEKSVGFFAEAVMRLCPHAAIEDEGRLTNFRLRHHFLTRLFAVARLRRLRLRPAMAELVQFHTEYKLQLMAYSQAGLKALGQIVAHREAAPVERVFDTYAERLARVMAEPARSSSNRNALLHAFGYFSDQLTAGERKYFLDLLEEYREERLPLSGVVSVLKAWVLRFEEPYLLCQRFLEPYPKELIGLTDSAAAKAAAS
jgi:uncharacterized protein YbgA (DUF1722 family)/uncharacterized protein YbbK (DUF523 family)